MSNTLQGLAFSGSRASAMSRLELQTEMQRRNIFSKFEQLHKNNPEQASFIAGRLSSTSAPHPIGAPAGFSGGMPAPTRPQSQSMSGGGGGGWSMGPEIDRNAERLKEIEIEAKQHDLWQKKQQAEREKIKFENEQKDRATKLALEQRLDQDKITDRQHQESEKEFSSIYGKRPDSMGQNEWMKSLTRPSDLMRLVTDKTTGKGTFTNLGSDIYPDTSGGGDETGKLPGETESEYARRMVALRNAGTQVFAGTGGVGGGFRIGSNVVGGPRLTQ